MRVRIKESFLHLGDFWQTVGNLVLGVCCRRSCTTALPYPRKVAPAGRKLGLIHCILISCIIWSMTQASLPLPCQILLRCTMIFLVFWSCLLDMRSYVNLWHKLQQLGQIENMVAGGLEPCTSCLCTMHVHEVISKWPPSQWQCGMNHLSYLS